ncbi:hypothetical protein E2I00_018681, partial [Balaenoptera physalus]
WWAGVGGYGAGPRAHRLSCRRGAGAPRESAYQDYILADCKASEVKEFTAEFLEQVLESSEWRAAWHTNVFTCVKELLDLKEHWLQELWVVFDDSGVFDQTALAIVHVRFSYQNIWRSWAEEEEEEYDYFVRGVEPRLRLHYDILEDQENVSMLEGLKLYSEIEQLKRKLKLIENLLLRYVFGYQKNANIQAKRIRPNGQKVTHVVSSTMTTGLLDKLCPEPCKEEIEIQFHSDPLSAVNACYEGNTVVVCPGHYVVHGTFSTADSIDLKGYGLPDDIVIEKGGKGDTFVGCTGVDIKISSIKFVSHDAVEGILIIHHGKTTLENYSVKLQESQDRCEEGILIKDFLDEHYDIPKISVVNNVIHNNEGYGVVLVKPTIFSDLQENAQDETEENKALKVQTSGETDVAERVDLEELIQCATGKMELYVRADLSEQVESNCEILLPPHKKGQMKKKRLSELGITKADDNLMSQEMFVSIVGNQFKWNGKGSFGTFLF